MSSKVYMTDGTAALSNLCMHGSQKKPQIVAFEGGKAHREREARHTRYDRRSSSPARSKVRQILESSEMYCSLKLEDFRGCPYRIFTTRGIAFLSGASSVLAVLSIVVAA